MSTQVRLPESLHQRLHDEAGQRDVSVNLLVTRAVSDYLARLPDIAAVTAPAVAAPPAAAPEEPA